MPKPATYRDPPPAPPPEPASVLAKAPPGAAIPRSQGSWYRRRPVLISAFALLAILGIAAVLLGTYWPFRQGDVKQSIEETFPGKVTFGAYRSVFFPHPGAVAENVELRRQTNSPDQTPLVVVKRMTIRAAYLDLFLRPGFITRVTLEGFVIHVPPEGSSSSAPPEDNTPSRARIGEVVSEGALLEIARHQGPPLRFDIHALKLNSVSDGKPFSYEIGLHLPVPPGEVHSHGSFGPWDSQDATRTPVSGKYSFENADLGVFAGIAGKLWSEGEFQGTMGILKAHGKVDVPDFEVKRSKHSVPLKTEYQAVINATNGDVQLQNVDGTLLKTKFNAHGSVAKTQARSGKTADIHFAVEEGRIQDVMRMFVKAPKPPLNGATSFRAHAIVPPGDLPFLKKLQLTGDFGIAKGKFTTTHTQTDIVKLSETGAGKKPTDDEDPDPDSVVSALSGHVVLHGGTATFSNFSFQVPDAEATMHGTYNLLNEKIDLHGTLRTTAKFSDTTSGVKSVILKPFDAIFKRKNHPGAKVPVQLTGTYEDPHAGLEIIK